MSNTSPADLAVTFRSISRRLREAGGGEAGAGGSLDEHVRAAGTLLHTTADPAAIADAIERVPADGWDESTLSQLRETALGIGSRLREIEAKNARDDD